MSEQTINITPTGSQIDYRTGDLPQPYTPKVIEYKGNIEAPFAFFSARKDDDQGAVSTSVRDFYYTECALVVNHKNNTILLVCGENRQDKVTVLGELKPNQEISEIGINQPSKRRTVAELRDFIKYNRKYLHSDCEFSELLKQLQSFNTSFTTKRNEVKDGTGNETKSLQHVVDEIPTIKITFNIRLFEGHPKERIPVTVEAEVIGGELMFLFYSTDISTTMENSAESLLESQVQAFESQIAIIHQ